MLNTFLNDRERGRKGDIFVNGSVRDTGQFRKLSCYIMQVSKDLLYFFLGIHFYFFLPILKDFNLYSNMNFKKIIKQTLLTSNKIL